MANEILRTQSPESGYAQQKDKVSEETRADLAKLIGTMQQREGETETQFQGRRIRSKSALDAFTKLSPEEQAKVSKAVRELPSDGLNAAKWSKKLATQALKFDETEGTFSWPAEKVYAADGNWGERTPGCLQRNLSLWEPTLSSEIAQGVKHKHKESELAKYLQEGMVITVNGTDKKTSYKLRMDFEVTSDGAIIAMPKFVSTDFLR